MILNFGIIRDLLLINFCCLFFAYFLRKGNRTNYIFLCKLIDSWSSFCYYVKQK
jgi:hypothetical protein